MRYPRVKFRIDAAEDKENYRWFMKFAPPRFVEMFLPADLSSSLVGVKSVRERRGVAGLYVEHRFKEDRALIQRNVAEAEKDWRKKEGEFFRLVDRLFSGRAWPKGKYVGYASVFNMYPRDVADKTFYFSAYDKKHAAATTAHELLHFMFFDYVKARYGLKENDAVPGHGPNYFWNVSEVFNSVLEGWKPYQRLFSTSGETYDYMNRRMQPRMKRLWGERQDVDWLLRQYFGKPKN